MLEQLLAYLREKALDTKPSVDELKVIKGLESVTAKLRDEAWKTYQDEQASEEKAEDKTPDAKKATTITTDTADTAEPTHRVTVKHDGFRRCNRAWQGSEEVHLTDEEVEVLEADSMFVVTEL